MTWIVPWSDHLNNYLHAEKEGFSISVTSCSCRLTCKIQKLFWPKGMGPSGSTQGEFKSLSETDAQRRAPLIKARRITAT